jgi:hypothetical protein
LAVRFVEALITDLSLRARDDITLLPFMARLVKAGRKGFDDQPVAERTRPTPPADTYLDKALDNLTASPDLKEGIRVANEEGAWRRVVGDHPDIDPSLSAGMHALHVLGTSGILGCEGYRGGLFLLSPNIHYPLHTHLPTELYYCVSGSVTIRHGIDGDPMDVTAGSYSITPRERLHSLDTGDEPALVIFGWVGEFDTPVYWWEHDDATGWRRSVFERMPDASWRRGAVEAVPDDLVDAQRLKRTSGQ